MERVLSKNLFNFLPSGQLDEDVLSLKTEFEEMQKSDPTAVAMMKRMEELQEMDDAASSAEWLMLVRASMEAGLEGLTHHEALSYGARQTEKSTLNVPTTHDGVFDVPVEIYTPRNLLTERSRAAHIYAHGGGGVALSAQTVSGPLRCFAVDLDLMVFNVDYRLAPETKCPNNIKDFYYAIKYVKENAEQLGVDPNRISIGGDSGGGYICLGAMVLLAEAGETDLVKLALPGIPMVDDYCFSDPLCMTLEERISHKSMRKMWKLIANDFESQKHSPHLFPGKASEELLAKFPPTIILENEFDMFITEATRLAGRLRRAGRLLEFVVIPGTNHTGMFLPGTKGQSTLKRVLKSIAQEYIHA